MLIVGLFEKAKLRQKHEKTPYLGQKWCARKTTDGEMAGKKAVFVNETYHLSEGKIYQMIDIIKGLRGLYCA
ncbi:hypothetical protein HMPREF6745_1335 [Prevotella sp. oral taxon 472 str. F0295]|nr:hypothetical protein HMPREF6745_1335 [Prevotella sp. oral taxon 472 str. F0295]